MMLYKKIALILMLVTLLVLPVSAWSPPWRNVYVPDGYSADFSEANYTAYCTEKGSLGYTSMRIWFNKVTGGGASTQICNAAGDCDIPLGSPMRPNRSASQMAADWAGGFRTYEVLPYCGPGGPYTPTIEGYTLVNSANPNARFLTFSISDSVTYSLKLPNVTVLLSNGQFNITNSSGMCDFRTWSNSSAYTYSLSKTGYTSKFLQSLGGYGETGGLIYDTMVSGNATLPAGYVRTVVRTVDALTGSQIHGTTINLKDVENSSWVNSTSDVDGELVIDTLDTHTLDIYGSYPGVYTASSELGAVPGGGYEYPYILPMYTSLPTAPTGYVNVLTYVVDAVTDGPIGSAKVTYTYVDGTLKGQHVDTYTDNWGASLAVLKNASVIVIDTSKPNYNGQSESHNLPNFEDIMYRIRLSKPGLPSPTVVPTDTYGNQITAVPTYLQYCNPTAGDYDELLCAHSQDNDLFRQLRESGSAIIGLCILAIIFGLLKMIMKF